MSLIICNLNVDNFVIEYTVLVTIHLSQPSLVNCRFVNKTQIYVSLTNNVCKLHNRELIRTPLLPLLKILNLIIILSPLGVYPIMNLPSFSFCHSSFHTLKLLSSMNLDILLLCYCWCSLFLNH